MVNKEQIIQWLQAVATVLQENKNYLTELDAIIGDADHGINMNRGFQKVVTQLPTVANKDIGSILKTVSMTLISSIGGASGPLYGTLFLRISAVVAGKSEITTEDMAKILVAAVEGVVQRGKANLGDKTMLDALSPAADTFTEAAENGCSLVESLKQAVDAAEQGMKNTIPMLAKKGRASYLGDRSIGHQDPGATSTYLILKTLLDTLESDRQIN
ncbi:MULTISPECIES: dihydroxyacetone kinase subunit DhaL [Okeania]|uniref:Dihydroxyacetone kinase subunit L n=1 Tax=Okeania hirsuta TaxID=1458930 RepID=A0A3N6NA26_9CYAN|nr:MULTISPECIES: dihydroxyacetone kinase subunit DhaL [Okeania]NET14361.1 dihydroxyacetone kinase subunit L [Okeania sp. SIO1H6]NES75116.1 dihydroxyacetone kinase subunit L [Okeania sp. SIO1H4]NES89454.1 dihydroxyacetone kinase subunit L [Okeania sp. SIO2B9]NET22280.1 dihydroxyacetone kinase subunit L [Okeania sp. SIO1H5]NET78139.1 dihydroxyacetone kinase subunit L [Okeania sp. SIO1F9]